MPTPQYFNKAEIYLTTCIHPDFSYLRYIGLDTKCDPSYLGSSVALKWFINKLGRNSFRKEIIEVVSGTMREVCNIEQSYIEKYDAVKDPDFLNMNGVKSKDQSDHSVIDLYWNILPNNSISRKYVSNTVNILKDNIKYFDHARRQLANRVICMVIYGLTKYNQHTFEYSRHTHYGSCKEQDLQDVLVGLSNIGYVDFDYNNIKVTQEIIESLPIGLDYSKFFVIVDN